MTLGVLLSFKESMRILDQAGQADRFVTYYLGPYARHFDHVYVFSWRKEEWEFSDPKITLVPNRYNIPMPLYALLMPFLEWRTFKKCHALRLMQYLAIIPAAMAKIFQRTKILATYGYRYQLFLKVKGRRLKLWLWKLIDHLFQWVPDMFLVTTEDVEGYLQSRGVKAKRILRTGNGVDMTRFCPGPLQQHPRNLMNDETTINLLYVGRIEIEKNLENLVRAIGQSDMKSRITLTIIGEGSLRGAVEGVARSLGVRVQFLGRRPYRELPEHFRSADIYVQPTHAEGHSKTILEAMATGLPVLVGAFQGHEMMTGGGKYAFVTTTDVDAIAENLNILITNRELRATLGKSARAFVYTTYNIATLVEREITAMQSL